MNGQTDLHSAKINGENSWKEDNLKKEVTQQTNQCDYTELLEEERGGREGGRGGREGGRGGEGEGGFE